jgi:hypothetical protein
MIDLTRRRLITTGVAGATALAGLGVGAVMAEKYGLIPPDHGGLWGAGETLNYASYKLITRHSLAREFTRSQLSARPVANEIAPPSKAFLTLQGVCGLGAHH